MKKKLLLMILTGLTMNPIHGQSICLNIGSPGYGISGTIVADPTDPNDAIICITQSNVVIQMNGFTIMQDPANTVGGFNGIVIGPDVSNVTIQNGTVQGVTGIGIVILEGCTNILIQNVNVLECNQAGILFDGNLSSTIQDGFISNCYVYSCTGLEGNPAYGLRMIYCDNITVEDSTFNRNDAGTSDTGYGVSAEWCTTCNFTDCDANGNGGSTLGVGFNIYNCQWTVIENCNAINNISRSSDPARAIGFLVDTSSYSIIQNCLSVHNNNALAEAYGFDATNGTNNLFENCIAKQNVGGTIAAGFLFENNESDSSLYTCESHLNNGGASGDGYGILLNAAQTCDILGNKVISNSGGATGIGLADTVIDTTNLINHTVSFNNTFTGYQVTRTIGSFPMITAENGDFSAIENVANTNIYFIQS